MWPSPHWILGLFQSFTHIWFPGNWGCTLMPKDMGILPMTHLCIWEMVCPNPCSCLRKFKTHGSLVSPLKLIRGVSHLYRISNGENPIPAQGEHLTSRGPWVIWLTMANWSPNSLAGLFEHSIHTFYFPWALRGVKQYAVSIRPSNPLSLVLLSQLQMLVHCLTLWWKTSHIWGQ